MKFPSKINDIIKDYPLEEDSTGRSGDKVYLIANKYVLKVSKEIEKLKQEKQMHDFLKDKLPVAKTICFEIENDSAYYLRTYLDGVPLTDENILKDPIKLIDYLCEAIKMIHSIDISTCKHFSPYSKGNCFIHGDLCLPNILVKDGKISGILDINAAGIGDPYFDYSWCIWSLEYNLKTKEYTPLLLKKLGVEFNKELYEKYTEV